MIQQEIIPIQYYADPNKPKIEAVLIYPIEIEKETSITFNVLLCTKTEETGALNPIATETIVIENPEYANWRKDDQIIDFILKKLNAQRKV